MNCIVILCLVCNFSFCTKKSQTFGVLCIFSSFYIYNMHNTLNLSIKMCCHIEKCLIPCKISYKGSFIHFFFSFSFVVELYLWWSLCTFYLPACQVTVTVRDSGLCCCTCVMSFEHQLTPLWVDFFLKLFRSSCDH